MAFDFNRDPLRLYGIFPQTPFPVEVSIYGYCRMSCSFCFANRNRDAFERELYPVNSTPALFRKLDRVMQNEHDPIGFFLRERYPVCFSNTTDPFQRDEKTYRATEAFLSWAKANRIPLYVQTRGNVLFEEWDRYKQLLVPGKDVVYISLCQLDDRIRKRHEPGAMRVEDRLHLVRLLTDHGIPVVFACNPWVKEWVPDPEPYCEEVAATGARGVWWECLHFTGSQADVLPLTYRDELLTQANALPMYVIGPIKKWRAACLSRGLDYFPTPRWDAYFGHPAKHPECADPAWMGGKTLDFAFRIAAGVYRLSQQTKRPALLGWREIEIALRSLLVPNPELNTSPFWYPFNAQVKADRESWNARLGKRAPLYEILRYFWNHPWESENFLWYHPFLQGVYYPGEGQYAVDEEGDLAGCFDPALNKHHFSKEIDCDRIDWDGVVWPRFE